MCILICRKSECGVRPRSLMQWESGRTRQNLIHCVSESKAKGSRIKRSFESRPSLFCTHQTCPFFSTNASPHWTILATSFWGQLHECSVSCNISAKRPLLPFTPGCEHWSASAYECR